MKRSLINNFVASHMRAPFGLPGGFSGYHNTPKEPEFAPFNEQSWNHDTVVDGDRLLDVDGNDITGQFDEKDTAELLEEEEDPDAEEEEDEEPEDKDPDAEEEEEEEPEDKDRAEEPEDKEPEDKEPEEEEVATETVQLTATFARLKRAESVFSAASKDSTKQITAESVAKELVDKRNALLRERSKIDPLSGDEAAERLAEIDIEVADLGTVIGTRINQAELSRRDSINEAKIAASNTVEETIGLIGKVYPQLNEGSKLYRADLADTFNALQEMYQRSMSVTDAMQKALETVVKSAGLKAGASTAAEKPATKEQKEAVKRRLAAKDKSPVRKGKTGKAAEDGSLRSLLTKDLSDPKVRSAMQKMTGMTFDE